MNYLLFLSLVISISCCGAQRNVFGSCPSVQPMENFDMEKFSGHWYVIKLFDSRVKCMEWDIRKIDSKWYIVETKKSGAIKTYNGELKPNPDENGALQISWSLNIGGFYPFTVLDTDYTSYAGIFMCQKVLFYTRQQGVLISRTPIMSAAIRQTLAGTLAGYGVEINYFEKVEQSRCERSTESPDAADEIDGIFYDFEGSLSEIDRDLAEIDPPADFDATY